MTETNIRRPADNHLLRDRVRVLTRLMRRAPKRLRDGAVELHDHNRAAKHRCPEASNGRGEARVEAYRGLVTVVRWTLGYVPGALEAAGASGEPWAGDWRERVEHFRDLVERVIGQTERRVQGGETVPSSEKVPGLFDPHTDIIVKRKRSHFGHKLNLSAGESGLVLDGVVERGNPADGTCLIPMLERHAELYGEVPAQVACDGGYASKANPISYLKRCFGLRRCAWRGLERFRAYVWSAVVAHNLVVLARSRLRIKPA